MDCIIRYKTSVAVGRPPYPEVQRVDYIAELMRNVDFSIETDLKARLRKQLLAPVRSVSLEELTQKNGLEHNTAARTNRRSPADKTLETTRQTAPKDKTGITPA